MRHIPEAELHAYLDQALSRSQCVEIEQHLAECAACHAARDEIAALRDRTTALLAQLAPAAARVPPFAAVRERMAGALSARRRRWQRVAWAASVVGGIGLGWVAAMAVGGRYGTGHTTTVASTGAPASAPADSAPAMKLPASPSVAGSPAPQISATHTPGREQQAASSQAVNSQVASSRPSTSRSPVTPLPNTAGPLSSPPDAGKGTGAVPAINDSGSGALASRADRHTGMTDSVHPVGDLVLSGPWKTVSWDSARVEAGGKTPSHIDGLPVVQVQVQKNPAGKQPTMVVAQQLSSGEVIRTVEGPANDVSRLFGRRVMTDPVADSSAQQDTVPVVPAAGAGPRGANQSMAMQRGDRIVAITGAISPDSLRAMMRRLHGGQADQEASPVVGTPSVRTQDTGRSTPAPPQRPNIDLPPARTRPALPR